MDCDEPRVFGRTNVGGEVALVVDDYQAGLGGAGSLGSATASLLDDEERSQTAKSRWFGVAFPEGDTRDCDVEQVQGTGLKLESK